MDFKIELVPLPVTDVDRAVDFYGNKVGWNVVSPELRFVQVTPPGSACSVCFGTGLEMMPQGSTQFIQVVVDDADKALAYLQDRDVACEGVDEAWVANDNAPGQVVVAGSAAGVEAAGAAAKERGAKRVLPLPVGGAFHTPLMAPSAEGLAAALTGTTFSVPEPVDVANVDAAPHSAGGEWRALLREQLCRPVRWRPTLERLGADVVVEVGPGGVLTGMTKRTLPDARALSVSEPDHVDATLAALG